ncbi:hypothetical protein G7Y89_g8207 [Cudoniella acicularis]|uniref:EXPERA domain-containing protein n=1 Tax=Cudoniella acicularis TaxID=354080 RepID=A0A8H4RJ32_9HELO|nr:hypothetical protein G7Y89_g8207 [Cudoniella acicularis]
MGKLTVDYSVTSDPKSEADDMRTNETPNFRVPLSSPFQMTPVGSTPEIVVDLQTIYPPFLLAKAPYFIHDLKAWYINTYNDRFFVEPPLFLEVFTYTELIIQMPVIVWSIYGLYKNSPKIPLVLLPYAVLVSITTLTCIVEIWSWPTPTSEKIELMKLYSPYFILPTFMGVDMFLRLNNILPRYRSTAKEILICFYFQHHGFELVQLKQAQNSFIRRLAKLLDTFDNLEKLEVGFKLPTANWGQMKNATYFYQLRFQDWELHTKINEGWWEKLQFGSSLDRRLIEQGTSEQRIVVIKRSG